MVEQNNELLLKNHETRPTGANPVPEANVINYHNYRGRGRGRGRQNGRGRGHGRGHGKNEYFNNYHGTPNNKGKNPQKPDDPKEKVSSSTNNTCFRCGSNGHWSRVCRTPKHLVDLFQNSLKQKNAEANFANSDDNSEGYDGPVDVTHLDVSDFYAHPEEKIDHLVVMRMPTLNKILYLYE